jgi:O-antigen ligase
MEWDDKSMFVLKDMFFAYLFFFITYKSITGIKAIKAIFWATVIPLPYMFKVFYANLSWMGFTGYKDNLRLNSGTFMELGSNEMAAFYATYTFIVFGFAILEQEKKRKLFLIACVIMNVYSLLYGFSRGAYLASIVGLVVFCWYNSKVRLLFAGLAIIFALLTAGVDVFPKSVTERFNSSFVEEEELDESVQIRLILWDLALDKFQSSPLVGIGFGNFKKMNSYGLDTHNYYVKLLCEGGLVSFFAFVFFMIASFKSGIRLLKVSKNKYSQKLAICFLACMTSLIIGNYFGDRFTHYPLISYFYVYLAMVMKSLEWSESEQQSENISPAFN